MHYVNVPDIDFVRNKGGCYSLSLEGFFTYISSVYFLHILVFCNYGEERNFRTCSRNILRMTDTPAITSNLYFSW